jgi:hypothetical protein
MFYLTESREAGVRERGMLQECPRTTVLTNSSIHTHELLSEAGIRDGGMLQEFVGMNARVCGNELLVDEMTRMLQELSRVAARHVHINTYSLSLSLSLSLSHTHTHTHTHKRAARLQGTHSPKQKQK